LRGRDVSIVTDPYAAPAGPGMGKPVADIVTLSHADGVSPNATGVGGEPRVVFGPGEYEIADVLIAGVATASEPGKGPANTAYVFRFDDLAICHLGRTSSKLGDAQLEGMGSVDVLLIPVSGEGALDPTHAAEVVTQLEPSIVIPMGYGADNTDKLALFCREMGHKEFTPESKLAVTRGTLPSVARVVVLESKRV
jgi:L-ascorbate metabolism protein UlaG (beta-lactamase superfamily)